MKKLLAYLKPYWKLAVLGPLAMFVEVACDLMQPNLMSQIVDEGIKTGNLDFVIKTGLHMVLIAIIGIAGGIGCSFFAGIVSQSFGADLREDLYRRVENFSFKNIDKFTTGSLITRLTNDVVQLQTAVLVMMRMMVRTPLLLVGSFIMAVRINARLALILIVCLPILLILGYLLIKKAMPFFTKVQQALDKVNTILQENLAGIRVVKAFVRGEYEKQKFNKANDNLTRLNIMASRMVGLTMPLMFLVMNMCIAAALWFGGMNVNIGTMQTGEVIAFINYLTQILFSLLRVGFMLIFFSRAKVSADRVIEILSTTPEIVSGSCDSPVEKGKVEFKDVYFSYSEKQEPVLKDINFTALPGQTIAIIGTTGSGKTTLVNLIPRFYDVTSGSVLVDDIDVKERNLKVLRSAIGIVPQNPLLFSGTIIENIKWGKEDATEEEVIAAAKAAQAHDFIMSFPENYNTVLGQRGVNLSGGQKQRLTIARALLRKPAILILDDSTSAVDVTTEARIQKALKEWMKDKTCFIITSRISSAISADDILVMEEGQIIGRGTHSELIESCAIYQEIYHSQMDKLIESTAEGAI
ncbi:MAG TPA: ABC transporter ATP-binding protein [Tepidanaerobacter syntrophicus]|uniref:ABC transporter ATP-binding protein n=1 Tax=Tepidanaerobacter syntrophicus TaxID=224999 RepID=UPI00175E7ABD|nr:ABC transporter ATP-binding protein [Tepidanaerobacter syntrophicus]HHV82380.1 ABC transporter ATP-binding protein [Tepidanaerobacter syntrophicus]